MTKQNIFLEAAGLLSPLGFRLQEAAGDFEIRSRCGKLVARGNLETMRNCAAFIRADAKNHPAKYAAMNEPGNQNEMHEAGRSMAEKINRGN